MRIRRRNRRSRTALSPLALYNRRGLTAIHNAREKPEIESYSFDGSRRQLNSARSGLHLGARVLTSGDSP